MLKVTKKPKTPNIIWDAANKRPLCKFDKKGILETNDETLAEKLKAMGHTVTGEVDKVETPVEPDKPDSDGEPDAGASDETKGDGEGTGEGAATPDGDTGEQKADGEPDAEKTTAKGRRSRK